MGTIDRKIGFLWSNFIMSRIGFITKPFIWFWNLSWIKKVLILLVIAGSFFWYWSSINSKIAVQSVSAKKGSLVESVSSSGEIDAKQKATLVFQTAGKLSWVGVSEGDIVRKGQAIASLDKTQLQATLKKYLNTYERERTEFNDTSDSADDVTLTETVERIKKRAQVDLDQTVIDVELQNEALRLATLYTPIAGIVTRANPLYAGTNVGPTSASYEIVNPDTVYFSADVNEIDVTKIKVGTPVKLELDAFPNEIYQEQILDISFSSKTTATGGTAYTVSITLPANDDYKFRLGMNGDAEFVLSQKNDVLLIPQTALVEDQDKYYTWVIDDGKAIKKEIKIGISSIDEVEIIEGLEEGEQVILRAPSTLSEGSKVTNEN
jgi:RND family efflux transporter MFP subunit